MKKHILVIALIIISVQAINAQGTSACNCWQTRDSSWSVVEFDGSGGSGGPGLAPLFRNDDWSSDTIQLPFMFCFYSDTVTEVYINNNGNVSVGGAYSTFTSLSFPDSTYSMIAPFWGDVDTRDAVLSGVVYYKLTSRELIVQWDHVGYFNTHADKTNTFQLIMTDGISNLLPEQKNIGFCYKDMQWTTGDASGGTGGFGGTPATAGVNYGNGINYLQIGRYDNSTIAYDGPYGNNDGIQSLSNQSFVFNVCVNNFNVAPILSGDYICDTIPLCIGDTFTYTADFLSPEQGQITSVSVVDNGIGGVNVLTTPGNPSNVFLSFVATNAGLYSLDIRGTDNGTPAVASTTHTLLFNIQNCAVGIEEKNLKAISVYPNPVSNELTLQLPGLKNNVKVFDPSGRILFNSVVSENSTLNTSEWLPGIYFITIQSEDKFSTFKIIKNN